MASTKFNSTTTQAVEVDGSDPTMHRPEVVIKSATAPASSDALLTSIDGHVDGVEAKLDTLIASSDNAEVKQGALTDRSGVITVDATSQQLAAALATRRYFALQNAGSIDLWFNFGVEAVASQPSFKLIPGASFMMEGSFISTQAIHIIGATAAGSGFTAKEG